MMPIIYSLKDAKGYYDSGYVGAIKCMLNKDEKIANSYEEAKKIYEEEQK
jgi:hypothetical protein